MKRILLTLLLIGLLPLSQFAQTPTEEPQYIMTVHLKGEQPILVPVEEIDSVRFVVSKAVQDFTLSPAQVELNVGDTKQLTVAVTPTDASYAVSYESSDAAVATVTAEGLVQALAAGTATITATIGKLQKQCSVTVLAPAKLPLEYVLEYNVDSSGTGLVTTHATDVSGYFTFEDAVAKFSNITIAGNRYHLPSTAEWSAIIPALQSNDKLCAKFDKSNKSFMDVNEKVVVQGDTIISNNDYRLGVNKITYGLRFKGTQMVSAWRYEYTKVDDCQVLKITARPVANGANISIEKVADPAFWESDTDADVIRYFPASGYKMSDDGNVIYGGSDGSYWTATTKSDKNAWGMYFYYEEAHLFDLSPRSFLRSVRLFSEK